MATVLISFALSTTLWILDVEIFSSCLVPYSCVCSVLFDFVMTSLGENRADRLSGQ